MLDFYTQIQNAQTPAEAYKVFDNARRNPTVKLGGAFFQIVISKLAEDKENHVEKAKKVYTEMKRREIVLQSNNYNTLIQICTKVGDFAQANFFFDEKQEKEQSTDIKTFNHFLSGYVKHNRYQAAYQLLTSLQKTGMADTTTQKYFNHLIRKNLKNNNLIEARRVYEMSKDVIFQTR